MKWLRRFLSLPFKLSIWAVLLLLLWVVTLGDFGPAMRTAVTKAWALLPGSQRDSIFDPAATDNLVRQLDLIEQVNERVRPRLGQVQILLREHEANVAYLRELCRFIEERFPRGPSETRNAAVVLSELATIAAENQWSSGQDRERFERFGGPQWAAYRQRIAAAERSIEQVLRLYDRVRTLDARLNERRLDTMRLTTDRTSAEGWTTAGCTPEIAKSYTMLEELHRELFTTLYALDPSLVETDVGVEVSAAGP